MSGLGLVLGCGVRVRIRVNVKVSLVLEIGLQILNLVLDGEKSTVMSVTGEHTLNSSTVALF